MTDAEKRNMDFMIAFYYAFDRSKHFFRREYRNAISRRE